MESFNCSNLHHSVNGRPLHVVMFPWLAHGHISPFIELSKRLAEKAVKISFVSTPRNIVNVKPSFEGLDVNLVELPLPQVDGLPPGIESTAHLPSHLMPLFHRAARGLEKPLKTFLEQISPDFLIFDGALMWASKVSLQLHIRAIMFMIFGAASMAYGCCRQRNHNDSEITANDLCQPPPGYPSSAIRQLPFEAKSILDFYTLKVAGDKTQIDLVVDSYYESSAIAIKSCYELEEKFIQYYEQTTGRPVVPVGPLLPRPFPIKRGGPVHEQKADCLKWLDNQQPSSVVYASFGSEYFLSKVQMQEIALGLEDSQQPFLWVVRSPSEGIDEGKRVLDLLPKGFQCRTAERGVVLSGWAPQLEILCHSATGGFMTHCGWSSVMEGMGLGLPLIAFPMQLDQGLNARLIAKELQVGVEVERGSDGSVSRGDVCKAVRNAMVEEGGRHVRSKAAEMARRFRDKILDGYGSQGSQKRYIEDFVKLLHRVKANS
uniref:Glycosyltransferase n=1 Tax=Araucaria cunninghamii TaxID=56994 RepID=A0A0D6QSH9_ARACU